MEQPIIFSGPMVRAILKGKKTQTRRVVKPGRGYQSTWCSVEKLSHADNPQIINGGAQFDHPLGGPYTFVKCPYGKVGDTLWVRETWYCDHCFERDYYETGECKGKSKEECETEWIGKDRENMYYRADVQSGRFEDAGYWAEPGSHWKPSIHIPRWASRITLEITNVGVERVRKISGFDARAEGYPKEMPDYQILHYGGGTVTRHWFRDLWNSINEKRGHGWEKNPWVWVISFKTAAETT